MTTNKDKVSATVSGTLSDNQVDHHAIAHAGIVTEVTLEPFKGIGLDDIYQQALKLGKKNYMPLTEVERIARSLQEIQEIILSHNQDGYVVRQARLSDIDSLQNMVNYWAQQGENLPRSREDLIRNIQSFAVCIKDEQVLGCACLYVYDTGLAEIRSLGINPMVQRQGQGRAIVEFLLHRALQYEIKKVFVLTRNPQFFSKVGFTLTTIDALPEKIRKDCEHCPKRERCDEVAYEFNIYTTKSKGADENGRYLSLTPEGEDLAKQSMLPPGFKFKQI